MFGSEITERSCRTNRYHAERQRRVAAGEIGEVFPYLSSLEKLRLLHEYSLGETDRQVLEEKVLERYACHNDVSTYLDYAVVDPDHGKNKLKQKFVNRLSGSGEPGRRFKKQRGKLKKEEHVQQNDVTDITDVTDMDDPDGVWQLSLTHVLPKIEPYQAILIGDFVQSFHTPVTKLDLSSNQVAPDCLRLLFHNGARTSLKNITDLNLSYTNLGVEGAKAVADGIKQTSSLQSLILHNNSLGDQGMRLIADGILHMSNIKVLGLSHNSIGAKGIMYLAECLPNWKRLKELRLGYNPITDQGAFNFGWSVQVATQLELLWLQETNIGDDGCVAISEGLQHCKYLRDLRLSGNCISNEGVNSLSSIACNWPNLAVLKLNKNCIADEGSHSLMEVYKVAKALPELCLTENYISEQMKHELWKLFKSKIVV